MVCCTKHLNFSEKTAIYIPASTNSLFTKTTIFPGHETSRFRLIHTNWCGVVWWLKVSQHFTASCVYLCSLSLFIQEMLKHRRSTHGSIDDDTQLVTCFHHAAEVGLPERVGGAKATDSTTNLQEQTMKLNKRVQKQRKKEQICCSDEGKQSKEQSDRQRGLWLDLWEVGYLLGG